MDLQLTGKTAIVTGSSKGRGFARARALVDEGCRVCLCARGEATLTEAVTELRKVAAPGAVLAVAADLATKEGAEKVVNATLKEFGAIDILVNNVGAAKG